MLKSLTFNDAFPGTRIAADVKPHEYPVKALTAISGQAIVSLQGNGMLGVPEIAARTFRALAEAELQRAAASEGRVLLFEPASPDHDAN